MDRKESGKEVKEKRNAFLMFIQKRKSDPDVLEMSLQQDGEAVSMYLTDEWEEMPKEEKQKYREIALAKIEQMKKDDEVRKTVTGEMKDAIKFLQNLVMPPDQNAIKNKFLDDNQFCKLWSYPEGRDKTAVVLFMNHYVSHELLHIPCEIGMVSFSIKNGILGEYWTLVDPGEPPMGEAGQFFSNVDKFGVPLPPFPHNRDRDYKRIVGEIETFMKQHILPETKQPFVVCLKDSMREVQKGMKWLFKQAGTPISEEDDHWTNGMKTIEMLFIMMSMAGLENVATTEKKDLKDVLSTVSSPGTSVVSKESSSRVASCSSGKSKASKFSSIPPASYTTLGNVTRKASYLTDEKSIIMGAFLFEQQVTDYIRTLEYAHFTSIACKFHNENELKRTDSGRIIECALSKAKRLVFLALDVVLINYGIMPVPGRHQPLEQKK